MARWHLLTCEYPPDIGGVADYSALLVQALEREGHEVHVWSRRITSSDGEDQSPHLSRLVDGWGPSGLCRLGRHMRTLPGPRRLLVQWVPHGYGWRSMNVPFCLWLWWRAAVRGDEVEIMVHEPFLAFGEGSWRQRGAALVHRLMTVFLLRSVRRVFVAIPAWADAWKPFTLGRKVDFVWAPVANVLPIAPPDATDALRRRYGGGRYLVGHFSAYGRHSTSMLQAAVLSLLDARSDISVLLIGKGGDRFREAMLGLRPALADRIHATGALRPAELSRHLQACHLMLQPYPDGVSSRRTTVMAALAHGVPVVTTSGRLTEPLWLNNGAIILAPAESPAQVAAAAAELLDRPGDARSVGLAGRALYERAFAIHRTVGLLAGSADAPAIQAT